MSNISVGSVNAAFITPATDVLNMYNRRNNMHDARREFPKLLNDLRSPAVRDRLKRAKIGVAQTIEAFEKGYETDYVVFKLAMSMSPLSFRAVLSGTVAWQAVKTTSHDWYSAAGPGVYAVGIGVDSREGKFLSAQEMGYLAQGFDRYSAGYNALQTAPGQRTSSQRRDVRHLRRIDNAISDFVGLPSGGRSIVNSTEQQHVLMFAERLRERAKAILSVDPTGQVIQLQSPLYIGSSDNMERGIREYIGPAYHSNVNKLLVLALNLLKIMNLPSSLHVRPVIRVWERHQLPYAERLVATLAESLVAQNGFNTAEAGGRRTCQATGKELLNAKCVVFSIKPFLRQHIDGVEPVIEDKVKFDRVLKTLTRLTQYLSNLDQEIDETEQRLRRSMALKPLGWTAAALMLQKRLQTLSQQTGMLADWKVRLQQLAFAASHHQSADSLGNDEDVD